MRWTRKRVETRRTIVLGLLLIFVEHLELLPRFGLLRAGYNTLVSSPNTRRVGHEPLLGSEIPDARFQMADCDMGGVDNVGPIALFYPV